MKILSRYFLTRDIANIRDKAIILEVDFIFTFILHMNDCSDRGIRNNKWELIDKAGTRIIILEIHVLTILGLILNYRVTIEHESKLRIRINTIDTTRSAIHGIHMTFNHINVNFTIITNTEVLTDQRRILNNSPLLRLIFDSKHWNQIHELPCMIDSSFKLIASSAHSFTDRLIISTLSTLFNNLHQKRFNLRVFMILVICFKKHIQAVNISIHNV